MIKKGAVLLDTSFFIRFLDEEDRLFKNADDYFRFFIQNGFDMMISTISIAEYCIGGSIDELPLKNLKIVAFNLDHAKKAGEFARIAFQKRASNQLKVLDRKIIPNDTKLFAQASCLNEVEYYLSSDQESIKVFNTIKTNINPGFQFIDLHAPYNETFSVLDL